MGIVQRELDRFRAPSYLEIGIHSGALFLRVRAARKVGVDPAPRISLRSRLTHPASLRARVVATTSDEFFAALEPSARFDVVFIDGRHLYEQALRDIEASLAHLSDDGVVLAHDCNPPRPAMAARDPRVAAVEGRGWCGDVWKAIVELRTRPGLDVGVLDTDFGIGVVRRRAGDGAPALDLRGVEGGVEALGYEDLEARRAELLGLRSVSSA